MQKKSSFRGLSLSLSWYPITSISKKEREDLSSQNACYCNESETGARMTVTALVSLSSPPLLLLVGSVNRTSLARPVASIGLLSLLFARQARSKALTSTSLDDDDDDTPAAAVCSSPEHDIAITDQSLHNQITAPHRFPPHLLWILLVVRIHTTRHRVPFRHLKAHGKARNLGHGQSGRGNHRFGFLFVPAHRQQQHVAGGGTALRSRVGQ